MLTRTSRRKKGIVIAAVAIALIFFVTSLLVFLLYQRILWALLLDFEIVPKKHGTGVWNILTNKQCISHFWPCQIYLFVNQQPFSFANDSLQFVDCISDPLFSFSFYVDTDTRARKILDPSHFHLIWIWIIENRIRACQKLHPSALSFADFSISLPRYTTDVRL